MGRESTTSTATLPPLDYLHPSPVRGQLEPSDEVTKKTGWRFIQCTDTPNELKVLLPPRTAQLYARLLKAEKSELAKKLNASWESILEIRHLKDRMIRKCQRLAHSYADNKPPVKVPFLSIHAPVDFRLKEMEKWIRLHGEPDESSKKMPVPDSVRPRNSFCCDRCANMVPHHHTISRRPSTLSRRSALAERSPSKALPASPRRARSSKASSVQSDHKPSPVASSIVLNESHSHHQSQLYETSVHESSTHQEGRNNQVHASFTAHQSRFDDSSTTQESRVLDSSNIHTRQIKHSRSMSYDERRFAESGLHEIKRTIHVIPEASEAGTDHSNRSAVSVSKLSVISPDPLPHPFHGSTSAVFLGMVESPVDAPEVQIAEPYYSESEGVMTPPSEDEPTSDFPPQPNTLRRRSSLKRSNNDLRLSIAFSAKTVSWAMDRDWADQVTKYNAAAGEIEHADREWDAICATYHEELAGMKVLRRNVTQTLARLRLEAEKLQREDEVIRDQEDKLRAGYEQLEQKHGQYREKVKAVLEETEQVLTLCGTKRGS
ncbi:hypothetical protein DEU56DRAFT_907178 [Suillus clintonianus]|uniref:uncharacterized protein n=1 Tax=Suillus clintonianus TaxID=1904413 RepID=UPI001B87A85E|nr:uncharacterized protein DEU56DRAFT_907178 [Suillus clintonianus]KAG2154798.1 hypothetical protein DEU56DRAFT_907178 [Suillus clintonianus]